MEGQVQDAQRSSEKLVSTDRQASTLYFRTLLEYTLNATAASAGTTQRPHFPAERHHFTQSHGKPATFLPTPENSKTGFLPSLTVQSRPTQLPLCQSCSCLTLDFSRAKIAKSPCFCPHVILNAQLRSKHTFFAMVPSSITTFLWARCGSLQDHPSYHAKCMEKDLRGHKN